MLGLRTPAPQDLKAEVRSSADGEVDGVAYRIRKLLLSEQDRPEAIPVIRLEPRDREGAGPATPILMVHCEGKRAWGGEPDRDRIRETIATALRDGREVFLADLWLTGEYHNPARRSGRAEDVRFFTTYNRTDTALRTQDLVTVSVYARSAAGASEVDLRARGDAGLWALLARPHIPGLGRTRIEGAGYELDSDDYLLDRCYVPGLRRLGGFRTAAILAAPSPLKIIGAGEDYLRFVREIYRVLGREDVLRTS
jgi:hypothetical protein